MTWQIKVKKMQVHKAAAAIQAVDFILFKKLHKKAGLSYEYANNTSSLSAIFLRRWQKV